MEIKLIAPIIVDGINDNNEPFASVDAKYGPYSDIDILTANMQLYVNQNVDVTDVYIEDTNIPGKITDDTKLSDKSNIATTIKNYIEAVVSEGGEDWEGTYEVKIYYHPETNDFSPMDISKKITHIDLGLEYKHGDFEPGDYIVISYNPNGDVYKALDQAKDNLKDYLTIGLTVAIVENNEVVEYWIKDDSNVFVRKQKNDFLILNHTDALKFTSYHHFINSLSLGTKFIWTGYNYNFTTGPEKRYLIKGQLHEVTTPTYDTNNCPIIELLSTPKFISVDEALACIPPSLRFVNQTVFIANNNSYDEYYFTDSFHLVKKEYNSGSSPVIKHFDYTPERSELGKINIIENFDWDVIFTNTFEFNEDFVVELGGIVRFKFNNVYVHQLSNIGLPVEGDKNSIVYDIKVRQHKLLKNVDGDFANDVFETYNTLVGDDVIEHGDVGLCEITIKHEIDLINIKMRFDFYGYEV